ncbi:MAG TPA: aminotransferase class I/II-fold pyridoxal phosphate-dependent enzyme, partial [Ignavibacteriaceae bacterium]|nr:aminotransferase class I/II-fold pyridoxal phosphate-dependent enzyme [Ignavibacteriaceae bacterium]
GPSPKALEVIKKSLNDLHRYTNPSSYKLVNAIAKKFNKKPSQIVTGSGSDSLIQYIITAFSDYDDELLTSQGTFIGWYVNVNKYGFKSLEVPLKNYHFDLNEIANNISGKTKIIYLANPNNPTGTMFTKNEFDSFISKVPENILMVLDEAYTVYAESNKDYPNGLEYEKENLIVLRTLSKAYGLAGLRIGFAFGPERLIKEIYKVKLPFEPNHLAQEAAIAAFEDDDFLNKTIELNKKSLARMIQTFSELGIEQVESAANFILILFPSEEFAFEFNEECLNRGLILRHVKSFGIPNGIRINSGTMDETDFALNVIKEIYPALQEKYKIQINN